MTLALPSLAQTAPGEALAAVAECQRLLPHDPEQWWRQARVLALMAHGREREHYAALSLAALRRAIDFGLTGLDHPQLFSKDLAILFLRPEFWAVVDKAKPGDRVASAP